MLRDAEAGFSLIETIVATAILAVALTSVAQLFAISIKANAVARNGGMTMILAVQKMEQLRSLTWGYDGSGLPISDLTTDSSVSPEQPAAGKGLSPSPADALRQSTNGYVDHVDSNGNLLGGGTIPPAGTAYLRRWSIEPLPTDPDHTLVLQVLVTRRFDRGAADQGSITRLPEEARLLSVKTRKAR